MVKMSKMMSVLLLIMEIMMTVAPLVQGVDQSPKAVERWFKKLPHAKQKFSKLHFYFHDIVSGNKPTAVMVARANMTAKSPTFFGAVFVMDDPLRLGPEPDSKIVGFAQGIYASASQEDIGLLMTLNFVFTDGKYKGRTLSVLGRNSGRHKYREMPVLGGSGVFRLARGFATAKTHTLNMTSGDAVVEYHVIVSHY